MLPGLNDTYDSRLYQPKECLCRRLKQRKSTEQPYGTFDPYSWATCQPGRRSPSRNPVQSKHHLRDSWGNRDNDGNATRGSGNAYPSCASVCEFPCTISPNTSYVQLSDSSLKLRFGYLACWPASICACVCGRLKHRQQTARLY